MKYKEKKNFFKMLRESAHYETTSSDICVIRPNICVIRVAKRDERAEKYLKK